MPSYKKREHVKENFILAIVIIFSIVSILYLSQSDNLITSFITGVTGEATSDTDDLEVIIDLFPLSREIQQGDYIRVSARIDTNKDEEVDVTIEYTITNNKGLVVFQKSKTLAVERTAKVTDNLIIHKSLDPGSYLVDIEVSYDNNRKLERDTFHVVAEPVEITFGNKETTLLLILLIILIIFFILLWIQNKRIKKILETHEKCDIDHVMK